MCELDLLVGMLDLAVAFVALAMGWPRDPRDDD